MSGPVSGPPTPSATRLSAVLSTVLSAVLRAVVPTALTRIGPAQAALRAAVAVLVVAAAFAGWPARPGPWLLLAVLALAVAFATYPESAAGTVALATVIGWWATQPEPSPLGALVAALCLTGAHVCGTLASYGPLGLRVDAGLLRIWAVRSLACAGVVLIVWVAVLVLDGRPAPAAAWPVGLVVALVLAALLAAALRHASADLRDGHDTGGLL